VSVRRPLVELLKSEPPSPGNVLVRRQCQASLPLPQTCLARRPPGASLAWAVLGILTGVVVALAGVVVALVYLLLNHPVAEVVPSPAAAVAAAAATKQQPAEPAVSSGDSLLDSKGYILPVQRILVSPKVSGMIVKLHIREGYHVKKGDVLAELEDVDYKADFLRAQSAVETAKRQLAEAETSQPKEIGQVEAEIERAKVELSQWKADFDRSRELFSKQATSKMEFEASGTKFRAAEQHLRSMDYALGLMRISLCQKNSAAHTQLEEAEAELVKVRWRLENCMVRAPSSGTILKKNAEEGNLVNPVAFNDTFSLCELANLSELEVELAIQERQIGKIKPGQRCKVHTEAFPDRIYDGVVSRLMPFANRLQSAIPIRVKITVPHEEEGVYLKPEMIAVVSFLGNAAVARLDEVQKASQHSLLHKPYPPTPSGASHRPLPASG
jgi:HlyD family secretion protein